MKQGLRLKAETSADLQILSAALQDAIGRVGDIHYDAKARALTLRVTRFQHEAGQSSRIQAGIRIDGVLDMKSRGLDRSDPENMAVILMTDYAENEQPPGGVLRLIFAGGGEIRATVEVLDIILADVTAPRLTDKIPLHPDV